MSMKINQITIEGVHNVTKKRYDLPDIVYIFGKNGAGKSTILQCVQFALLGYIPGTAKKNGSIFSHSSNSHVMSVKLVLSDENNKKVIITRGITKSGNTFSQFCETIPEDYDISTIVGDAELPLFNFSDMFDMSANALKSWFIDYLPNSNSSYTWENIRSTRIDNQPYAEVCSPTIDEIFSTVSGKDVNTETIKDLLECVKSHISLQNIQAKSLQGTLESLVYYADAPEGVNIDELNAEKDRLHEARLLIKVRKKLATNRKQLEDKLADLKDYPDTLKSNQEFKDTMKTMDSDSDEYIVNQNQKDVLQHKIDELEYEKLQYSTIANSNGICPYSSTVCETIQLRAEEYKQKLSEIEAKIAELNKECKSLQDRNFDLNRSIQKARNRLSEIQSKYQEKESLLSQLKELNKEYPDCPEFPSEVTEEEDISRQIDEIDRQIVMYHANKQYQETMDRVTKDKFKTDMTLKFLADMKKLLDSNGLPSEITESTFNHFADVISEKLRTVCDDNSLSAKFVSTGGSNSFSFGVVRNDDYISYELLSSGEKCLFQLALMLTIAETSSGKLKLVMIDDMFDHLDEDNFQKVLDGMTKISGIQVIVAGVKPSANAICMNI